MYNQRIAKILETIEKLKKDLRKEYLGLQEKYDFFVQKRKIVFSLGAKNKQRAQKMNVWIYALTPDIKHLISMPFIYWMIFPAIILDIFLYFYQWAALLFYWIPRAERKDYFIYDRRFLVYLNIIQKFNCLYCSYVNWLFAFAVEVGSRTEQYWCPIKHAVNSDSEHKYFKYYSDYWDPEWFNEIFNKNICFKK